MSDPIRYYQDYNTEIKEVNGKLELVRIPLKRWVCAGGNFAIKKHKTEKAARLDAEEREAFNGKYAYSVPKGKRTGK